MEYREEDDEGAQIPLAFLQRRHLHHGFREIRGVELDVLDASEALLEAHHEGSLPDNILQILPLQPLKQARRANNYELLLIRKLDGSDVGI